MALDTSSGDKKLVTTLPGYHGQEYILIPAGPFLMGSTEEELSQIAAQWGDPGIIEKANLHLETPKHEVYVEAFYIGKYPVTNAEWKSFMESGGYRNKAYWPDPDWLHDRKEKAPRYWRDPKFNDPRMPVVGVDWRECVAFCNWLSEVMWRPVRLLTEAEWEKAASWDPKNKSKRMYPWGDEWDQSRCNSLESGRLKTWGVGAFSPRGDSAYGVSDMVGNVNEYCSTLFSSGDLSHFEEYLYPYQHDDGREETSVTPGSYFSGAQIMRGGNWDTKWLGCRCSYRQTVQREVSSNGNGLRVGFSASESYKPRDPAITQVPSMPKPETLTITDPISIELVRVPGGEFLMGTEFTGIITVDPHEHPQHKVSVSEFYIGKYPITEEQYLAYVIATNNKWPHHFEKIVKKNREGDFYLTKDYFPVVNVSWHMANEFCDWFSEKTGKDFRLPTEAEWEYAARGGPFSRGFKYAGSDNADEVAWHSGKDRDVYGCFPVGQKIPNELGLYDMSGNVAEWCSSVFAAYPYDPDGGREAREADANFPRVVRGGHFQSETKHIRCASRAGTNINNKWPAIGFRVVVSSL